MIDNDAVRQALGTLERYAPAESEVLAGMRARIVRRRRRRQIASVAGVAGAASAVALGVVIVAPDRANDQGSQAPPATATPPPTVSVQAPTPLAPPVLPFTAGWVPDGYTLDTWTAGMNDGSAQYVGTKDFQTVVISVSADPHDSGPGVTEENTEIAGRPGVIRRLPPDRLETQLVWQLANGQWVMVGGRAPTVSLPTLRKVAENLSTEPTPMTVSWGLKAVPDGYPHASWMASGEFGSIALCDTEAGPRQIGTNCINVSLNKGTAQSTILMKNGPTANDVVEIPVDQEKVVNGVTTRANAKGDTVFAQLDADHWVALMSNQAGVELLREVASNVTLN